MLSPTLMESVVKRLRPQNISETLQQKRYKTGVDIKMLQTAHLV